MSENNQFLHIDRPHAELTITFSLAAATTSAVVCSISICPINHRHYVVIWQYDSAKLTV